MYSNVIAKVVSQLIGCEMSDVKLESKLKELVIDSLDIMELIINLEDEIGMDIELDRKFKTVNDLNQFIMRKRPLSYDAFVNV